MVDFTGFTPVIIGFLIAGVLALLFAKKLMHKNWSGLQWVGGLVVVGAVFFGFGGFGLMPDALSITGNDIIDNCDSTTSPTVTVNAREYYNPATSNTDQVGYKINNQPALNLSDGATIQASPGDVLTFLMGDSDTTATSWYGGISSFTVPCKETTSVTLEAYDMSASSPIAFIVYDDDGVTKLSQSTSGNNLSISASDRESYDVEIKGTYEDSWGATKMAVCVEYNTTEVLDLELSSGAKVNKPSHLTTASGFAEECWEFPAIRSSNKLKFTMSAEYDDSSYPASDQAVFVITAVDDDAYENDAGDFLYGYFDMDSPTTGLGQTDQTTTLYTSAS